MFLLFFSVTQDADPHNLNADLDPSNTDPDSTFLFTSDPDLAPDQRDENLHRLVYTIQTLQSTAPLLAFIVSVHGRP
jgi:hypothetical protein